MRTNRLHEAGSATAEFALATVMLVPMVFYAMYVGEAFVAGIKAQEAEISATWEMTAYRLHNYQGGGHNSLYTRAAQVAQARVREDLQDFDSYDTSNRQGRANAAAEYELLDFKCGRRTGSQAGTEVAAGYVFGAPINLGGEYLHADGYVGCQAKVEFRNRLLPRRVHREFDKGVELLPDSISKITLCGSGNTVQGCKGSKAPGMVLLTDDWGLEDPSAVPLGKTNSKYYRVGEKVFSVFGGAYVGVGAILMGFTPLVYALDQAQTGTFKMSYQDRISKMQRVGGTGGPQSAHVSPYHEEAHDYTDNIAGVSREIYNERRPNTYLGKQDQNWNAQ